MPHIALPEGLPGISAGFAYRPETAKPMRELAHILLHEPSSLTPGERELIATFVSSRNNCQFCQLSHGAAAACHLDDSSVVEQVKADFESAPISDKLKALLAIAGRVQQDGKLVTKSDVEAARSRAPPTSKFTTPSSSPQLSACITATLTASAPGSPATRKCTQRWASTSPNKATSSPPSANPPQSLKFKRSEGNGDMPFPSLLLKLIPDD